MSHGFHVKNETARKVSSDTFFRVFSVSVEKLLKLTVLALILLFILYPMICIFMRSLYVENGIGFSNYAEVFFKYKENFLNSITVGISTALLCTFLSVCTALFVYTRTGKFKTALMAVILISMVAPPFVSSLAYIQLYGRRGWITYRLLGLSLNPYNAVGVVLMQSISFVPMNALFLLGILSKIDTSGIKAAQDLGARPGNILKDVAYSEAGSGYHVRYGYKAVKKAPALKPSPLCKVSKEYGDKGPQNSNDQSVYHTSCHS